VRSQHIYSFLIETLDAPNPLPAIKIKKVKIVKPEIGKIATVSIVLVIIIQIVLSYVLKFSNQYVLLKSGVIISIVSAYWIFFNKIGWQYPFFRIFGWLCDIPNLNGRFEGTVERNSNDEPHKFVMEIKQTYMNIWMNTYSRNSFGRSIAMNLVKDDVGKFHLFSTWTCRTSNISDPNKKDDFYGSSITSISKKGDIILLEDEYFTRRNPPTQGKTLMKYKSKILLHRYE